MDKTDTANNVIAVKGLSVSYDRKRVLTNIFLDIQPGHLYGVVGPNGAGKSTLFKAMLGLIETNAGTVSVNGKPVESSRKEVVYVPQKSEVDWTFPATVLDIVLMGRYPHKKILQRMDQHDRDLAQAALQELGIESLRDRQIGELSGGQQQRVFLARALCQEASIFFLDEPFVGVDITTEEKIIAVLKRLAAEGKTLLVVHHDLSTVPDYFDRVIFINQRLVAYGDTEVVFSEENIAKTYGGQLPILHRTGMWENGGQ
jgi:ABC-type Mn2+/Zn2+ transport system ATPase subunit